MPHLEAIRDSDTVCRLGWALLHSLWLGVCVAAAFSAALVFLRRRSAQVRYLAGCVALVMMVVLPVAAFFVVPSSAVALGFATDEGEVPFRIADASPAPPVDPVEIEPLPAITPGSPLGNASGGSLESSSGGAPGSAPQPLPLAGDVDAFAPRGSWPESIAAAARPVLPWAVLFWAGGVVVLALRQLGGWIAAERLKRLAAPFDSQDLLATVSRLATAMRVSRPVNVLESMLVRVPTVIGWLRPVILLPVGVATGLTAAQLEAILAHELAHIRRYDYLVNLLQALVETLLFYHPAVWFISRRIRAERENCCDDIAVAAGAERFSYAESLLHVARRAYQTGQGQSLTPAPALGATGKPSQLRRRIGRLLGPAEQTGHVARSWLLALACLAGIVITFGVQVHSAETPNARQEERLRACLIDIIDDITAIKHKFPELAAFDADAARKAIGPRKDSSWCLDLEYSHEYKPAPSRTTWSTFGKHGCYLVVRFFPLRERRSISPHKILPAYGVQVYFGSGLPKDAWQKSNTEIYIFSAQVFGEKV